jgi:hypothetical protein
MRLYSPLSEGDKEMRVRIKQSSPDYYDVQVWRWWWPVLVSVSKCHQEAAAIRYAKVLKNPTIVEFK